MITKCEKSYIAGFFDGEGSITAVAGKMVKWSKYRQYTLAISFYNNNREILYWLQSKIGGNLYYRPRSNRTSQFASMLYLRNQGEMLHFVNQIIPYARIKKPQLLLAQEFLELRQIHKHKRSAHNPITSKEIELLIMIRECNMKNSLHAKPLENYKNIKEEWQCTNCLHIWRPRKVPPYKCPRPNCQKKLLKRL